ncbi:hypothetical protein ACIA5D_06890 [Actinoplanes sp. NPDC051513]|uniref:hypothetical protein n=1 Tax=Actinoplanes sp. NPDC051513 TaxID=3363908 RepID=UPI0037B9DDF7
MIDQSNTADGSWMSWTATGLAGIAGAVILISVLAPDMITGSQQEHLAVAAFGTWLWGLIGSVAFLTGMGRLRGAATRQVIWTGLAVATLAIWLLAAVLAITVPRAVTGTDPTQIPIAAMVAPIAATVLTGLAGTAAKVFATSPG